MPNNGLSASGVKPRQPLMHSVLPGSPPRYGFGRVALEAMPSSHVRFVQVDHFGFAPSVTSMKCSSSSQSPTWIVCVTMSGYEYCGIAASMITPGWRCP